MIALPYALALALGTALVTLAAAWGIMQSTVKTLTERVSETNGELRELRAVLVEVGQLKTTVEHHTERLRVIESWRDARPVAAGGTR
jgi:hypothetical protein